MPTSSMKSKMLIFTFFTNLINRITNQVIGLLMSKHDLNQLSSMEVCIGQYKELNRPYLRKKHNYTMKLVLSLL